MILISERDIAKMRFSNGHISKLWTKIKTGLVNSMIIILNSLLMLRIKDLMKQCISADVVFVLKTF